MLRGSTLPPKTIDWFKRYSGALASGDVPAFKAFLHEDCTFQFNNQLPLYGRDIVALAISRFRASVEGMRHQVLAAYGAEFTFGVELLHHYLRKDGVAITVPAAVMIDRDPETGLMFSSRALVDFTPVFAETLKP